MAGGYTGGKKGNKLVAGAVNQGAPKQSKYGGNNAYGMNSMGMGSSSYNNTTMYNDDMPE